MTIVIPSSYPVMLTTQNASLSQTVSPIVDMFGPTTASAIDKDFLSTLTEDAEGCFEILGTNMYPSLKINKFLAHPVLVRLVEGRIAIALPLVVEQEGSKTYYIELCYQKFSYNKDHYVLSKNSLGKKFLDLTLESICISSSWTNSASYPHEFLQNIQALLKNQNVNIINNGENALLRLVTEEEVRELNTKQAQMISSAPLTSVRDNLESPKGVKYSPSSSDLSHPSQTYVNIFQARTSKKTSELQASSPSPSSSSSNSEAKQTPQNKTIVWKSSTRYEIPGGRVLANVQEPLLQQALEGWKNFILKTSS